MKFNIELSWSKLVALIVIIAAAYIDKSNGLPGTVFMFSLPFATFLITGKQFFDNRKAVKEIKG